jgi:hypothetical protein
MKSRLAVSLLFILIASTFASDATAAFEKLRWTGKVCGRCEFIAAARQIHEVLGLMRIK